MDTGFGHVRSNEFRSIRVFVSSTFRDMRAEREELVKRIFPQLRRLCESRGVVWSEVDLRWGVTDEQAAEGAVLPICLAEIDRSRPFFIGLLGQRYGWVPERLPAGLVDQLPWLSGLSGRSVTEIEILHGVLNDPASAGNAFFYIRDPAWIDTQPIDEQSVLNELEDDEEVEAFGAEAAAAGAAGRRERLEELKRRVRDAGLATWQYPDPRRLGERVLADFTQLIDRSYPDDSSPDVVRRDASAHRAFGLAQTLGHVGRAAVQSTLDAFAEGAQQPVVVHGEPGAGTTALVSAWVRSWEADHRDDVIIEHHVGATAEASEWQAMARRIVVELSAGHQFGLATEASGSRTGAAAERSALFAALARAGESPRRTVIVVGNADLLSDDDGAPDLTWLPAAVAPMVRIVITTSGPRPVEAADRKGWPAIALPPLAEDERRALLAAFLRRYSKGLDEVHVSRIVTAPATGNSLYLRTVLDELRQHGEHFTLGSVIDHYLGAETLDDLLGLVLARYERDFERDRAGLVADAMRALWAARRGLSDPELLDTLGDVGDPLPHAVWSPLMLAAESGLVTRSGQLVFATESHRRAVERRYAASEPAQRSAHAALARTFSRYELGPRVVEELPWQQLAAGDIDGVVATISDLDFLGVAYGGSHGDLRRLWATAEAAGHRVVDAYRGVLEDPAAHPDVAWEVARLVTDAGYPSEALRLNRWLVETYRAGQDETSARRLPAALVNLASALFVQGELLAAEPPLQEAINLARSRHDLAVLATALGNLALIRRDRGDTDTALAIFAEEEAIWRRMGDAAGLQSSLGNRAAALRQRGDLAGATALLTEQEDLCRSIGDDAGVVRALAGKGAVASESGNPAEALASFRAYREVSQASGDLRNVAEAAINEVTTLRQLGRHDESERSAAETEALVRRLGDGPLLARVLDARSRTAIEQGRWADARRLADEALLTARAAGVPAVVVLALGVVGTAWRELGDLDRARAAHLEEERLATVANQPGSIATAQVNLASVDIAANDLPAALVRYAQAEPVLRSLNLHMVMVPLLNNRWQVHAALGNTDAATLDLIAGGRAAALIGALPQSRQMLTTAIERLYGTARHGEAEPLWAEVAEVCRALDDEPGLQQAIGERALMVLSRGDTATAAGLLDEQEAICRRINDLVGLASCVGNRAILLRNTGDLGGALRCVDEQIELAKAGANGQGYLFATANRGEILGAMGRVEEGLMALKEARTIAANHGLTPMVAELDQMIAGLGFGPR